MPNFIDLSGRRFGIRTVIERSPIPEHITKQFRGRTFWRVKCDCGSEQIRATNNVKNNHSCGCTAIENGAQKRRKPFGESARNGLFIRYKHSALQKSLAFTLTLEQCDTLWKGNCHYCNAPPAQRYQNGKRRQYGPYLYNGIDRSDNNEGYTPDNSLSCCKKCNYLKRASSYQDFVDHISTIFCNLRDK